MKNLAKKQVLNSNKNSQNNLVNLNRLERVTNDCEKMIQAEIKTRKYQRRYFIYCLGISFLIHMFALWGLSKTEFKQKLEQGIAVFIRAQEPRLIQAIENKSPDFPRTPPFYVRPRTELAD